MKEKLIVALATLNITLLIYIGELPHRANLRPGGEIFIPLFVLAGWWIGHSALKNRREENGK